MEQSSLLITFVHNIYPIDGKWPVMVKLYTTNGPHVLFPPESHPGKGYFVDEYIFSAAPGGDFSFECCWHNLEEKIHHSELWFIKTIKPSRSEKKSLYTFQARDMFNAIRNGTEKGENGWERVLKFERYFLDVVADAVFRHDTCPTTKDSRPLSKKKEDTSAKPLPFLLEDMTALSIHDVATSIHDVAQPRTPKAPSINPFKS